MLLVHNTSYNFFSQLFPFPSQKFVRLLFLFSLSFFSMSLRFWYILLCRCALPSLNLLPFFFYSRLFVASACIIWVQTDTWCMCGNCVLGVSFMCMCGVCERVCVLFFCFSCVFAFRPVTFLFQPPPPLLCPCFLPHMCTWPHLGTLTFFLLSQRLCFTPVWFILLALSFAHSFNHTPQTWFFFLAWLRGCFKERGNVMDVLSMLLTS